MARKWLGSLNATKKASARGPAPNTAAITTSRRNPVRREISVSPPTVAMRLIMQSRGLSRASPPSPLAADQVKEFQRLGHAWQRVRLYCRNTFFPWRRACFHTSPRGEVRRRRATCGEDDAGVGGRSQSEPRKMLLAFHPTRLGLRFAPSLPPSPSGGGWSAFHRLAATSREVMSNSSPRLRGDGAPKKRKPIAPALRHAGRLSARQSRGLFGAGLRFSPAGHARMRRPILQPAPGRDS